MDSWDSKKLFNGTAEISTLRGRSSGVWFATLSSPSHRSLNRRLPEEE